MFFKKSDTTNYIYKIFTYYQYFTNFIQNIALKTSNVTNLFYCFCKRQQKKLQFWQNSAKFYNSNCDVTHIPRIWDLLTTA